MARFGYSPNDMYENPWKAHLSLQLEKEKLDDKNKDKPKVKPMSLNSYVLTLKPRSKINHKGYKKQWNEHPLKIIEIKETQPVMYKLEDNKTYYKQELQQISNEEAEKLLHKPVKTSNPPQKQEFQPSIVDRIKAKRNPPAK